MSSPRVITCECGVQVRLPADAASRSLRCPRCKAGIALTVDARVLSSNPLKPGDPGATCPICQTGIGADEFAVTCPQCHQVHHRECWSEVGGCSTYGCTEAPAADKSDATATQPRSAWGDDKNCPACGETIKSIALRCRYCGTDFETVDPMTAKDLRQQGKRKVELKNLKATTAVIFVASLLGVFAPITGVVGACVFLPKRAALKRCGPLFQVLAYASLGLSALYSLMLVLFLLFETVFHGVWL